MKKYPNKAAASPFCGLWAINMHHFEEIHLANPEIISNFLIHTVHPSVSMKAFSVTLSLRKDIAHV